MKKDLNAKLSRGALRTLDAFSGAMMDLLRTKPLTSISVNELCERSSYPRATFYNYFDDRDDLLRYCWTALSGQVQAADLTTAEPQRRVDLALDMLSDLLESKADELRDVLKHNPADGPLFASLRSFIADRSRELMRTCIDKERHSLPLDLVADHYANTLMLVLDWAYLRGHALTRPELHDYVHALLGEVPSHPERSAESRTL
ncbi:TetR/AcrR family transcriptional regulator [Bifidobacterium vespertilionis]|uniref:TetR/AcrR family transcriptional regulator n=1 Tax=Bifidobacterium vespertilionis TaxID=2562524 RepID=A0A5J5DZV7_9BIFI|nr:TetR/AcrR family transcriptional regulator [Bifidobacterium vespertilionis]KAA8818216.1 TetR/AcrR family transcriptional regulator [Bifidobacterium vespertilionis]KAA8822375.1 TetR/AcrR family transcriptional regulator [Bifidobacterium vespertilionis]